MTYDKSFEPSVMKPQSYGGIFDLPKLSSELEILDRETSQPEFWNNPQAAARTTRKKASIEREIQRWTSLETHYNDLNALVDLAEESGDPELLQELTSGLETFQEELASLRVELLLSGERAANNAFLAIHPGAGGTESQDWAQMLLRMYVRWAERKGFTVETIDLQPGEEAGIKSATLAIKGPYSYGYLKSEAGVHRLVRISPFDSNKRRHTSFVSVFVYPELEEDSELVIDEKELRIDTFRSGGAGGQNVNKVETAIRITHLPTGLVVQCQNERSQLKNKMGAMKVLKSRLFEIEQKKKDEEFESIVGEKKEIGFGSQIRSYVFQPYQMVKDHRTGFEIGNVESIMDGGLDPFIDAYLQQEASGSIPDKQDNS